MSGTIYLIQEEFNNKGNITRKTYAASTMGLARCTMKEILKYHSNNGIFGVFVDSYGDVVEQSDALKIEVDENRVSIQTMDNNYSLNVFIEEQQIIIKLSSVPKFK